jgi:hypothetical protein
VGGSRIEGQPERFPQSLRSQVRVFDGAQQGHVRKVSNACVFCCARDRVRVQVLREMCFDWQDLHYGCWDACEIKERLCCNGRWLAEHVSTQDNIQTEAGSVELAREFALRTKTLSSVAYSVARYFRPAFVSLDLERHEVFEIELSGRLKALEELCVGSAKDKVYVSRRACAFEPNFKREAAFENGRVTERNVCACEHSREDHDLTTSLDVDATSGISTETILECRLERGGGAIRLPAHV